MQPKKINRFALSKLAKDLKKGSERVIGNYLYKGFHIQISRFNLSTPERVKRFYSKRRKLGLCIRCGEKVTLKNPKTGKLFRLCEFHRKKIDRK